MKKLLKNIFTVSYLTNEGARRLCLILGILLALVPTYFFATKVYVSKNVTLRDAVVDASTRQQRLVFEKYPYQCNFCDLETDFNRWQATFGSWQYTNDVMHADCSKLRDPSSCISARRYLDKKVEIGYFDFSALLFLVYAGLLFYVPSLIACAIQWILVGFKQGKARKK